MVPGLRDGKFGVGRQLSICEGLSRVMDVEMGLLSVLGLLGLSRCS